MCRDAVTQQSNEPCLAYLVWRGFFVSQGKTCRRNFVGKTTAGWGFRKPCGSPKPAAIHRLYSLARDCCLGHAEFRERLTFCATVDCDYSSRVTPEQALPILRSNRSLPVPRVPFWRRRFRFAQGQKSPGGRWSGFPGLDLS